MCLLVDENISFRILKLSDPPFEGCQHVSDIRPPIRTDREIWEYAAKHDLTVLTFDGDFFEWRLIEKSGPKIIWLRFGNTKTGVIASILKRNAI